jgi:hypothetical protein
MRLKKIRLKKTDIPCMVCNPDDAQPGEYCQLHTDQLRHLDHQYELLFRFQRTSRGKDHESYNLLLQGDSEPCGKVLVTETDPENLLITVLISGDINLEAMITEYGFFKIERTFGDQLRNRIRQEIVYSWYGNSRACIEVFRMKPDLTQHWDIDPRPDQSLTLEEEDSDPRPPQGGKHSIH